MTTLIEKSILNERLEKSRSGIYADTSENRRKHRVGQKYGSEKKEEEKPEKTDPNKMSPEQQLEAINKVIAAINEGKLKLPPEEINTLVAKKTMAEEAVKQAKGEKKPEEKEESKKEATKPEAKSEGKKEDKINQEPNTYITPENSEGYVRNLNKLLDVKGYFAYATRTGGIEIYKKGDRKSLGNLKASIIATDYISWGPNENLKDMLEPLIKEALSSAPSILDKLIDISVDFNKEDLKSLDDKSLNELKDKLREKYNKEDKLERRAFKRHGYFTANPESAKYNDRLRAVENEIKKRAESKNEPEKNEKPEPKQEASGKASDPIYQVQQKKKEASKRYDSKREEARQKYDKEADEIRSEIDKLYESDHPDAAKKRKELWNTLKEKTNKYDAETTRLKDEYEAEYKKLDEAEDKLYDQRQKEETSEEVKESYTRVKFEDVPNSGKVNLKKYLSDKVKRTADENLGILSKVSTENLKKMEAGLVKEFNSQFGSLSKSRRAEKLYSIMKVKSELENRKQEEIKKYQKYTSSLDDNTLLSIGYDLNEEIRKLSSRGFSTLDQQEEVLKKISELSVKRQINEDEQRKRMDKLNNLSDETRVNKKGELAKRGNENQKTDKTKEEETSKNIKKAVEEVSANFKNLADEVDKNGWNMQYIKYGDVDSFNFDEKDSTLTVYATGKGYGNTAPTKTELTQKDWDEYNKTAKWVTNFRGEREPVTTDAHGAITIAKELKNKGIDVKKIVVVKEYD